MTDNRNPLKNQLSVEPDLADTLDHWRKLIMLNLNCHHVGTIERFDEQKQTASVKLAYQQTYYKFNPSSGEYDSELVPYPILLDCPVMFPGGASSGLTFPVKQGDECLVLFNDRDIDRWFEGQTNVAPGTLRTHSISDGFVFVGIKSERGFIKAFDNAKVVLRHGDNAESRIEVGVGEASMISENAEVSIAQNMIKIANNQESLKALMTDLNEQLSDLVTQIEVLANTPIPTTSPALNPGVVDAVGTIGTEITDITNRIGNLLQ